MKRAVLLLGAGIGYVLGARAGRDRYEQITETATRLAQSPPAQRAGEFRPHRPHDAADGIALDEALALVAEVRAAVAEVDASAMRLAKAKRR